MTDVLVVAIDSTGGWRTASEQLVASLQRAGASVELVRTPVPPTVRTFVLTDLVEARMARRAARDGIARFRPRALIYCSVSAALLWPRPGAIFLDSTARENRPGRHGVWQRPVERRRLAQSPLLLSWSARSLDGYPFEAITLPPPVDLLFDRRDSDATRDVDVVIYAGDPQKRRLDYLLGVWEQVRRPGERLVVTGAEDGPANGPGRDITYLGRLSHPEFLALLGRTRVFLAAPRREDHGIAALEALAAGCQLVTAPAPGPYLALDLARAADPRLVATDVAKPLRTALDNPLPDYFARVAPALEQFTPAAVDRTVADDVLPRLLAGWGTG